MERKVGTISRGVRCPIIRENDNLADIVVESVLDAAKSEGFELRDRDVISVTESIVARAQGNYASIDAIAEDVKAKLGGETIGVIFPILSRRLYLPFAELGREKHALPAGSFREFTGRKQLLCQYSDGKGYGRKEFH